MRRGPSLVIAAVLAALSPAVLLLACGSSSTAGPTPASAVPGTTSTPAPDPVTTAAATPAAPPKKTMADCAAQSGSAVELPSSDAGMMNNAQPDASFDRSKGDIDEVVKTHRDQFRCCYDLALVDHPALEGSFVLDFTLNPDGSLKTSAHNKGASDIKDDGMGECALGVLKTLHFPASKRGKESTVSYPFGFKPKGAKR